MQKNIGQTTCPVTYDNVLKADQVSLRWLTSEIDDKHLIVPNIQADC